MRTVYPWPGGSGVGQWEECIEGTIIKDTCTNSGGVGGGGGRWVQLGWVGGKGRKGIQL